MEQRQEQGEERAPTDVPAARRCHQGQEAHGEDEFPTQRCDKSVDGERRREGISATVSDRKHEGSNHPDEADRREEAERATHESFVLSVYCSLVAVYRIGCEGTAH